MKIDLKLWAVIGVLLVILVLYLAYLQGQPSEPVDPMKNPSRIVKQIEKHVEQDKRQGSGGMFGTSPRGAPSRDGGSYDPYAAPGSKRNLGGNPTSSGVNNMETGPTFSDQYYGVTPKTTSPGAVPAIKQGDGYYPPPAIHTPDKRLKNVPQSNLTTDGQQVAFNGVNVYVVSEDGSQKTMPDGTYKLQNGVNLVVQGGRKIIINN